MCIRDRADRVGANDGAAYTLFLNTDGTVAAFNEISDGIGGLPAGTLDPGDLFGSGADGAGDINGDGIDDFLVGARNDDTGGTNRGAMHILYMTATGQVGHHQLVADGFSGIAANTLADGDGFGWAGVAPVGDIDGNGTIDFATGALRDDDAGVDTGSAPPASMTSKMPSPSESRS